MKSLTAIRWTSLAWVLIFATLFAAFAGATWPRPAAARPLDATPQPGTLLQVFNNTWMNQSSLGLVYDPDRGLVRYAHESQSKAHRPTIFDVDAVTHTDVLSIALSSQNAGWRWQIDNRDGVGYDYIARTYFLPDYQGDQSYSDDNLVEIDAAGNILNAWEMDNSVGSNDSADDSKIDKIIDIAVVPGTPNRYFATAAYDAARVYEIVLTRTGRLWMSHSWATLAVCTVPTLTDNLGIDYDAQYHRLYHSDWKSRQIIVTDLTCDHNQPMNVLYQFTCPGAGGYNSGVTFIEGSDPPEIWVTDFDENKTTRCVAVGRERPPLGWEKTVAAVPWTAGLSITTQLSETFTVMEVVTAGLPFTLTDAWDAGRLQLGGVQVEPPLADVVTATGALTVTGNDATPQVVTVTKHFLTLPCTWTQTVVSESLDIEASFFEQRPFTVTKCAPLLHVTGGDRAPVYAGGMAHLTLAYSNTGCLENDVLITSTFPTTAPILYANPAPDDSAADHTWARWDVGDLADGDRDEIDVYVYIGESAGAGTFITITTGIHNHAGGLEDEVETVFEVVGETADGWIKTIDDGGGPVSWSAAFSTTLGTGDIFTVTDVVTLPQSQDFTLSALWITSELSLKTWVVNPTTYASFVITGTGWLNFVAPSPSILTRPVTLTQVFTVESCSWPQTVLWEHLVFGINALARPVLVRKDAPNLALTAVQSDTEVYGGETVTYTLSYSNTGGYENQFTARADLPASAAFVSSDPAPSTGAAGEVAITWVFTGGLATGQVGYITVTARITDQVPPATRLVMTNTLLDHAGIPKAVALVVYEVEPPAWEKHVNEADWGASLQVDAGDVFTVTDIITSQAAFSLVDRWLGTQLILVTYTHAHGGVISATGRLTWTVDTSAPEPVTLTKRFRVEAFPAAYSVLWEDLYVGGVEWERRPVFLERATPDLRLAKSVTPTTAQPGDLVSYTLAFSNAGMGTALGVVLTDTMPVSVTGTAVVSSSVPITWRAGTRYVWNVADLDANAGGVITISGVLSDDLPASLVTNIAELAASNQAQAGGASPGDGEAGVTAAASVAVDGAPITCTLDALVSGTTYAFCNGICGAVTFTDTGTVSSLTITFTQRYPSINGEGLPRQYQLGTDGAGFAATLTLCYADEELDIAGISASDEDELRGHRYLGFDYWYPLDAQVVNSEDNTITIEDVTQFSAWGIGVPGSSTPTVTALQTLGVWEALRIGGIVGAAGLVLVAALVLARRRQR